MKQLFSGLNKASDIYRFSFWPFTSFLIVIFLWFWQCMSEPVNLKINNTKTSSGWKSSITSIWLFNMRRIHHPCSHSCFARICTYLCIRCCPNFYVTSHHRKDTEMLTKERFPYRIRLYGIRWGSSLYLLCMTLFWLTSQLIGRKITWCEWSHYWWRHHNSSPQDDKHVP